MKIIGLTGGIGSGKSTFCDLMAQYGIATIDTDRISRQVVAPNSEGLKQVIAEFGAEMLNADGSLNRAALREKIFADASNQQPREKLEAILHPLIQAETQSQIKAYQTNANYQQTYLLVAIPLLVEGILKKGKKPGYIDEIWVLDCAVQTQIERASQRDGSRIEQIKNILANQASRQQRLAHADKIIDNDKGIDELKTQIAEILKQAGNHA